MIIPCLTILASFWVYPMGIFINSNYDLGPFLHAKTWWHFNEPYIYGFLMDTFYIDIVQTLMEYLLHFTIIIKYIFYWHQRAWDFM